ncbi:MULTISPECIES: bis(5'-nucleosyl)-tetraphosphatase (symmetrical) YqeK [Oceanobacillus]|uniref:bis(5'-nucleosyl)-tetraphosphatase (symmetrical) n=1 Tax=Oceanobacillus profundus TaxID=372463 RepID=A0A417YJK8_9BACI|nr:bis(5'-nucleosyl)-tetraphosphatase (symmetrical) YqeK [Oceanobacillus profundus]MBR3120205.1 bis(5'-nucleosyl)-tetraphosphatase (symmetrical) YqeK [Oceanobacillus sp.]MCM3396886.1 bis(5'-nucleosyl)-tetraphosphatase (symmetrical) YqeK [Oceanobacillus profundus]PAE31088.1 phosphohydrolase [Paenibacillus sp. 7884-2]RHW33124.1 HD domain-containing protein [Oceanobacillus profundus]
MNITEATEKVKPHLTVKRFEHTQRVAETAVKLAHLYEASPKKAELAAILHDYAKYRSLDEMERWIRKSTLPKDLLDYHHELWHGPVGAILIEREFGIVDKEIQSAVQYHTTGKAGMSKLDKIIFLADYIEPGRSFPGIDKVRGIAEQNLTQACWMASKNTITYLMSKNVTVYPDSFHAYNDLTRQITGGSSLYEK